jgi:hypothetical protein
VWWYTSVIPTFWRLRQEDCEFEASLSYLEILGLKNKPPPQQKKKNPQNPPNNTTTKNPHRLGNL